MTRSRIVYLAFGVLAAAYLPPTNGRAALPPGLSVASSTTPAPEPDEAERLFRQMETRFVKAKSLDVTFAGAFEGTFQGKLKGTLTCGAGNKSFEEIDGDLALGTDTKKPVKLRMVSDGTKMAMTTDLGSDPKRQLLDTSKDLGAAQRLFMARAGVICPTFLLAEPVRPDEKPPERRPEEHISVGDFRLGGVEKVGGRDARAIHHSLTGRTFKEPLEATVWLDAETNLPLKRVITVKQEPIAVTLTESYSKISLDEKIDEKRFELPKE